MLRRELERGERLLWSGQPAQGLRWRPADWLLVPFSLLWGGFAFVWEYLVLTSPGTPWFMAVWGIPFVLVGLYLIFGRFLADRYQRARTWYAVTDQRVLIVRTGRSRQVQSLALAGLGDAVLSERGDGPGSIVFGPVNPMAVAVEGALPGRLRERMPAFELLEQPRRVWEVLREAQRAARGRS